MEWGLWIAVKIFAEAGTLSKNYPQNRKSLNCVCQVDVILHENGSRDLISDPKFAIIAGFPDMQGICNLDLP